MEKPVTLIIGLGQTVGEAIAKRFDEGGHNVLAVGPDQALLDDLGKTVGDQVARHHGPIHTRLGLRNAMAAGLEAYGHINNIICTPALPPADSLMGLEIDTFEDTVLESLSGAVKTLRVFVEEMISARGELENTADRFGQAGSFTFVLSLAAARPQPGWFSESVVQNAVLGVVKSAAMELAEHAIRVNTIVALRPRAEGREPWLKDRTPVGRAALPEEIAEAAYYLAGSGSAIVTGEALYLDGGRQHLSGLMVRDGED
ncbi:MAG: SDR family oxidoreductase [Pseudomonadota bacterium]